MARGNVLFKDRDTMFLAVRKARQANITVMSSGYSSGAKIPYYLTIELNNEEDIKFFMDQEGFDSISPPLTPL